jgi:hypothetical protein
MILMERSSEGVLEEAGLAPIKEYINQRKAMIQGYVTSQPIYQQCIYSKPIVENSRQSVGGTTIWKNLKIINYRRLTSQTSH